MRHGARIALQVILCICLSGCAAGNNLAPANPVGAASIHELARQSGGATATPGIFLVNTSITERLYEYARTASGNDAPIRIVTPRALHVIGVDRSGNIYSTEYEPKCEPCRAQVQSADGTYLYTVVMPETGRIPKPSAEFAAADGSVYYYISYTKRIVQISPGPNGKVVRTIDLPKEARKQTRSLFRNPSIFATADGVVYYYGAYGTFEPAIYVWGSKANGSDPPSRIIAGDQAETGIYGVDSSGNAWSLPGYPPSTIARYFGPKARGAQQPTEVTLQGAMLGINALVVASSNQLVYEGVTQGAAPGEYGPAILVVAGPFGAGPIQTLTLPSGFDGTDLVGVTF
jgi:hypothetical protein